MCLNWHCKVVLNFIRSPSLIKRLLESLPKAQQALNVSRWAHVGPRHRHPFFNIVPVVISIALDPTVRALRFGPQIWIRLLPRQITSKRGMHGCVPDLRIVDFINIFICLLQIVLAVFQFKHVRTHTLSP